MSEMLATRAAGAGVEGAVALRLREAGEVEEAEALAEFWTVVA